MYVHTSKNIPRSRPSLMFSSGQPFLNSAQRLRNLEQTALQQRQPQKDVCSRKMAPYTPLRDEYEQRAGGRSAHRGKPTQILRQRISCFRVSGGVAREHEKNEENLNNDNLFYLDGDTKHQYKHAAVILSSTVSLAQRNRTTNPTPSPLRCVSERPYIFCLNKSS